MEGGTEGKADPWLGLWGSLVSPGTACLRNQVEDGRVLSWAGTQILE